MEWSDLTHAYGAAKDVPGLLAQLADYPRNDDSQAEPYFTLWSSLCHQGDVYTASYAAVPHILGLAEAEPTRVTFDYLLLPVSIEIARLTGRGPQVPQNLEESYADSIKALPMTAGSIPVREMDETICLAAAAAIPVAAGLPTIAEAILELEGDAAKSFLEWKLNQ